MGPPLRRSREFTRFVGAHIVRPRATARVAPTAFEEVPAYPVGAGVLTGPHVYGTFPVIGGRMRTSAPTHHAFGPHILIGPFVCGRFPAIGGRTHRSAPAEMTSVSAFTVGPDDSAGRQPWVPRSPEVTLIRPSVRTGAPSPLEGEGFRAAQVCRPHGVTGGVMRFVGAHIVRPRPRCIAALQTPPFPNDPASTKE